MNQVVQLLQHMIHNLQFYMLRIYIHFETLEVEHDQSNSTLGDNYSFRNLTLGLFSPEGKIIDLQ